MGQDFRKDKKMQQIQDEKKEKIANLPMNQFINGNFENGKKVALYILSDHAQVEEDMRMCQALVHQLRHTKSIIIAYKEQYDADKVIKYSELAKRTMTREELFGEITLEKGRIWGTLADLRFRLFQVMLQKMSNEPNALTPVVYDQFVKNVEKALADMGLELFPTKIVAFDLE